MDYISTDFGVDSSGRFSFKARTDTSHTQTNSDVTEKNHFDEKLLVRRARMMLGRSKLNGLENN